MTAAASYTTSGDARAAAAKLLADADRLAESEEQERLDAALRHQSETMTAAAAAAAATATASAVREAQRRDDEKERARKCEELLEVTRTRVAELLALHGQLQTEQRASQQAAAEATRVSQQAAAEAKEVRVRLEAENTQLRATISALQRESKETECSHKGALQTMEQACSRRIQEREAAAEAPSPVEAPVGLVIEAPAVAPASPPAAAAPKPTAPTADRADPAEAGVLPAAQVGALPAAPAVQEGAEMRTPAEEPPARDSGDFEAWLAYQLLHNPKYTRSLTGSARDNRRQLPRIAPEELGAVETLLNALPGLLYKLLPGQPELVKEGMRLAEDYLRQGKDAACASASPWESWLAVSRTRTLHVHVHVHLHVRVRACAPCMPVHRTGTAALGTLLPRYSRIPHWRAQKHVGIFHIDNWAPKTETIMVQDAADAAAALARVRALGPDLYLNQFVDKHGLVHYTGAAGWGALQEVTGGAKVNTINVNTRSQYTPTNDKVGYGSTAPSDAECDMAMVKVTLAKVLNDAEMLLGCCSSSIATQVRTVPPPTHTTPWLEALIATVISYPCSWPCSPH